MSDPIINPADPIQQQILDSIVEALKSISTARNRPYTLTPTRIRPGIGSTPVDGLTSVYLPRQKLVADGPQETQQDALWSMDAGIEIVAVAQSPAEAVDRRAWTMWAEVYRVLCALNLAIPNVQSIVPEDPEFYPDADAQIGYLECIFKVQYQHLAGDPYAV